MKPKTRRALRVLVWLFAVYALGCVVAGIVLAEMSLHLQKRPLKIFLLIVLEFRNGSTRRWKKFPLPLPIT